MKRYAVPFLISAFVPPVLYLPFLFWSPLDPIQVWISAGSLLALGIFIGLLVAFRFGVREPRDEESLYFYTASPAIITIVVQAIVLVAFSYFEGGIFVRLDLKGWVFLTAAIIAFYAWLKFPPYLVRRFAP